MELDDVVDSTSGADPETQVEVELPTSRFAGQNDKDWTVLTPLETFLQEKADPVQWLKNLTRQYKENKICLDDILAEIPSQCGWVRSALPQFKTFTGQQCILALGFCPQYGEVIPPEGVGSVAPSPEVCFTDIVSGSVARIFGPKISLCVRKDCRKSKKLERATKNYRSCLPIGQTESVWSLFATQLEIEIAQKDFNIHFRECIAFSTAAQDVACYLDMKVWNIPDPSPTGRCGYTSLWLANLGIKDIAKQLAAIDNRDVRGVYEALRQDINKGRPAMVKLGTWDKEGDLADERYLRRREIEAALEDGYIPRHKKTPGSNLILPLTKKQAENRATRKTPAHKDAQKRYEKTEKARKAHLERSRKSYQKVKAEWQEEKKLYTKEEIDAEEE